MREVITTKDAGAPAPVYSQAIKAGELLFISGQLGVIPGTRQLVDKTIEGQTHQTLNNMRAILAAAGATLDNVVKCTVFLRNPSDWAKFNEVYLEFFPKDPPARSAVGVSFHDEDTLVEVEAIAYLGE